MGSQIETSDQSRKQRQGGLHRSAWPKNVLRGMLKNGDGIGAAILDGSRSSISDSGSSIVPLRPHCSLLSGAKFTYLFAASSLRGWSLRVNADHANSQRFAMDAVHILEPTICATSSDQMGASHVVLEFTLELTLACKHIPDGCSLGQ